MADRTLTINHADGGSETYTINRDKFAGVREMSIDGNTVTVDHTAVPKEQSKETTFGGSKSITIKRDIEPLLTKVVGGASAAYSLRDLNDKAGSSKVVRVRRKSDNLEKDFLAKEVKDIEAWVNSQVVPPLDVRELVDGERTGALIPAAAAYSLRNLSASYTGNVVGVRRSSDDAEELFTAAEVADGTLADWVNTDVVVGLADSLGEFSNAKLIKSVATVDGESSFKFVLDNQENTTHYSDPSNIDFVSGQKYNLSFKYFIPSGQTVYHLNLNYGGYGTIDHASGTGVWKQFNLNFTATQSRSLRIYASDSNISIDGNAEGEFFALQDVTLTQVEADGFVSQWYDQSGNGNHATQGTDESQPKIVDGGSLVSGGIDFDGVNDTLVVAGNPVITANYAGTYSAFSVQTIATSVAGYIAGNASPTNGSSLLSLATSDFTLSNTNKGNFDEISRAAGRNLLSACYNNGDASLLVNGGGSMVDVGTYDFSAGTSDFRIGSRNPSNIFLEGKIEEIIIYNSDQSDNRTAFEANIGETYGIDLPSGVDTGYDQVDGFVETWYDQSGNGNDATQETAGNQPKIVDAGSLVTTGGNPTVDFYNNSRLETTAFTDGSASSSFSVINNQSATSTRKLFHAKGSYPDTGVVWNYRGQVSAGEYDFVSYDGSVNPLTFSDLTSPFYFVSSTIINSSKDIFINGLSKASSSDSLVADDGVLSIGSTGFGTGFDIQEIIIYNSDQSANRAAIEANINNQYDIY